MTASAMQAARRARRFELGKCRGRETPMSKPAVASISLRILIMTISLGRLHAA